MTAEDPRVTAMLAHIVSQTQSNVEFLVSQNYLSRADANKFLAKLPSATATPVSTPPARRQVPAAPQAVQARAIWGYNENGADPKDLSFSAGDVVEIVDETNGDWWTGKFNGKQGLFPSTYVEKIATAAPVATAPAKEKPAYRPFGAAYHGMDKPPPPSQPVNSLGLQETDNTEKQKKYGGLKNTMANSAASGVGFGAGAAVGGGLVRALF